MVSIVQSVRSPVRSSVRSRSLTARGLCSTCGSFLYVTRETKTPHKKTAASRIYVLRTYYTLCTAHVHQRLVIFAPLHVQPHRLHNTFFIKKMQKKVCGKENVAEFRDELKTAAPEFYALAKDLYAAGLIDGLRGATLEIGPFSEQPLIEVKGKDGKALYCKNCGHWQRDTIGDGTGIGNCLLNVRPSQPKWPRQAACEQIQELA